MLWTRECVTFEENSTSMRSSSSIEIRGTNQSFLCKKKEEEFDDKEPMKQENAQLLIRPSVNIHPNHKIQNRHI